MRAFALLSALAALAVSPLVNGAASQTYTWKNVKIGGGGGFVPGFVFSTKEKGYATCFHPIPCSASCLIIFLRSIAYARTDIGGLYKLNADDSWTPLLDFADNDRLAAVLCQREETPLTSVCVKI
jgi:xyloglucan-specific exo-beta-1,4-glucanase